MIICTLKELMNENGTTQSELANKTSITRPTLLSLIRNDNQSIKYQTINEICNYFEIDMSELLKYSPIEVTLTEVKVEKMPNIINKNSSKLENNFSISLIYDFDGATIEFDTNLFVNKSGNSLENSNKLLMISLIDSKFSRYLDLKKFDTNFIKHLNYAHNIDEQIKKELKSNHLNTDFHINDLEVDIQEIKSSEDKSLNELINEFSTLLTKSNLNDTQKKAAVERIDEILSQIY